MRPYDGYSDQAMADPTAACREIISGANFDGNGQEFWLRYIIAIETGGVDAILQVYDQNEAVAVAANLRFAANVPKSTTTMIEFPAPGVKFTTNITAGVVGGSGTLAAYQVHAGGYISGGMGK